MTKLTQEQINTFVSSNYEELSKYKNQFKSYNPDDVEDAFQAAYYHIAMNSDNIEVQGSPEDTIRKYFYTTMLNKLRSYYTGNYRYMNTEFVDEVPGEPSQGYVIEPVDEDTSEKADASIILAKAKALLTREEYDLIYQVVGQGRPAYAVASELGTTKYLVNAKVNRILHLLQKNLK